MRSLELDTFRTDFDTAGNLEDEVAEFIRLQDMHDTRLASIGTAFSSFPTCCS
ncbi:hypothetical protein BJY24_006270 [Nocardia transvalensis]|uniref:Uncharacterized protein n=1 Tax=Nocardia transvalensis TaxID=37333 RepID=A0A7W9ULA5_9NOCA|nr:hypothetical protein [Nocardia transvalensis]MBB5917358.1 hypothetical protein [Nocardia transvalensis]